jgi:hypothetical protein
MSKRRQNKRVFVQQTTYVVKLSRSTPVGKEYLYKVICLCPLCSKRQIALRSSVNPYKTHMQFKRLNALTGLSDMNSIHTLACGHSVDLEGLPVQYATKEDLRTYGQAIWTYID